MEDCQRYGLALTQSVHCSGWQISGFTSHWALLIQFLDAALSINIVASSPINIILANLQPSTPTANANAKVLEPLLTIS